MTDKITIQVNNGDPVTYDSDNYSKIHHIRADRNSLLADSDSMMISDRGLTDAKKAKWVKYRQELRDMDFSDPDNITWPTKP